MEPPQKIVITYSFISDETEYLIKKGKPLLIGMFSSFFALAFALIGALSEGTVKSVAWDLWIACISVWAFSALMYWIYVISPCKKLKKELESTED